MAFDDIFDYMNGAGWYQISLYMLLGLPSFYGGVQSILMTFLGPEQDHWCYVDRLACYPHEQQKHVAIPRDHDGNYDHCHYYDLPYDTMTDDDIQTWNRSSAANASVIPCGDAGWFYDQTEYFRTAVMDYNLVCDRAWLVQMAYSVSIAAKLIMGILGGVLADRYGRRPLMLAGAFTHVFFVFGSAYATTYGMFVSMRTLLFCTVVAVYATGFVIPIEIFAPDKRFIPGGFYWCYWSLGFMVLPAMAYFVRDSVKLQLVAGLPMVLHMTYAWLVPESPRWELTQGRTERCNKTLKHMAEVNGDQVPHKVYDTLEPDEQSADSEQDFWTLVKLSFTSPTLLKRFLLILPAWAGCNIVYYGLSYNTGVLSGSLYLNTALSGFVEIPANILTMYLLTKAGRKYTQAISLMLAGLANFSCIPFIGKEEQDWLMVTFSMLGKACITVAFTTLCFFALELFPTSVRAIMYNASALIGGCFALLAPFMGPPLIAIWPPLPLIIFGGFGIVAGALVFFLPDTSKADLPDSIRQAEDLGTQNERRRDKEEHDGSVGDYGSVRHRGHSKVGVANESDVGVANESYDKDNCEMHADKEMSSVVSGDSDIRCADNGNSRL